MGYAFENTPWPEVPDSEKLAIWQMQAVVRDSALTMDEWRVRQRTLEECRAWWECDGCGVIGTLEEVEKHIIETNPDPNFERIETIKCWGAMEVGSQTWADYHQRGIHPMATVRAMLEEKLMDTGLIVEVLKEE